MNTATIKSWSFRLDLQDRSTLCGLIYGDTGTRFRDGEYITSSEIIAITDCGLYKKIETKNTVYKIYPDDIDPEYEKAFSGAYERIKGGKQ